MVSDWLQLISEGKTARMLADLSHVVDELNVRARDALIEQGKVERRGRCGM